MSMLGVAAIGIHVGASMGNKGVMGDGSILSKEAGGIALWSRRVHRDVKDRAPSIEEGPVRYL